MRAAPREKTFVSTTDLARILGLHRTTVINLVRAGKLQPDFWTPGGHARFRMGTARRLLRRQRKSP